MNDPLPARYRLEHQAEGLAPLILGVYRSPWSAREAFRLAVTNHRLARRAGWIVLIDQAASPEREMKRLPLSEKSTIH